MYCLELLDTSEDMLKRERSFALEFAGKVALKQKHER